jgi:hypothetical protein
MSTLKFKTALDSTQYDKGVENIKSKNTGLGGSLGGVQGMIAKAFAAGAVIAFGRAVANGIGKLVSFGGAMTDMAYQTGVSVETLQGLMLEVRKAGGNSDTLTNSLTRLRDAQGAVVGGDKAMIAAFKELGLSQQEVASMDTETLFRAMSKALTESGNSASAYSAVVDVLGKKNVPRLLEAMNALGSGTGELNQGFGKLTTANAQALDALSDGWSNFWTDMKEGAANAIGEVVRGFSRLVFGRDIGAEGEARAKQQAEIEAKARVAEAEKVKQAEIQKSREATTEKKKDQASLEQKSKQPNDDKKKGEDLPEKGDKFAAIGGRLGVPENAKPKTPGAASGIADMAHGGPDSVAGGTELMRRQAEDELAIRGEAAEKLHRQEMRNAREVTEERIRGVEAVAGRTAKPKDDIGARLADSAKSGDKFSDIGERLSGFESQQLQFTRMQVEIARRAEDYLARIAENTKEGAGLA